MKLVDEPQLAIAQHAAALLVEPVEALALDLDLAGTRFVEPAEEMEQRALARTGRADDRDDVTPMHRQVHRLEDMQHPAALLEDLGEAAAGDDRRCFRCHRRSAAGSGRLRHS